MKNYNLNIQNEDNILGIKNAYLVEVVPKIPNESYGEITENIEITLTFKAPYFDKTGKRNFYEKDCVFLNKLQITKNINLK